MMAKMRMGPKGQVVIPKMFRDNYGLMPGEDVVFEDEGERIVVKKSPTDIVEVANAITEAIKKSGRKVKITTELLKKLDEEEYEEKHERIRRQRLSGQ